MTDEVTEHVGGKEFSYRPITAEAGGLVFGDRHEAYGHPVEDFNKTAGFWTVYKGVEFTPEDVAFMMFFVKVSRQMFRPKRDNTVDACGYLECLERIIQARGAGVSIPAWQVAQDVRQQLEAEKLEDIHRGWLAVAEQERIAELVPSGVTIEDLVACWHRHHSAEPASIEQLRCEGQGAVEELTVTVLKAATGIDFHIVSLAGPSDLSLDWEEAEQVAEFLLSHVAHHKRGL